jgi:hypothetical protein
MHFVLFVLIEFIGFIAPAVLYTCFSRLISPLFGEILLYIVLCIYFIGHKIGLTYKWKTYKNNHTDT